MATSLQVLVMPVTACLALNSHVLQIVYGIRLQFFTKGLFGVNIVGVFDKLGTRREVTK